MVSSSTNLRDVLKGSGRVAKEHTKIKEPKVKVDGTLNINTLITAGSLLVSGALAYATLDKRISLLEQQSNTMVQLASERSQATKDELAGVRVDIKELTKSLNRDGVRPK